MDTRRSSGFHTTHWSLIAALPGREDDPRDPGAQAALEHLCREYWPPLYAFVRHRGFAPDDARDLVQAFLASVIESRSLGGADRERGRFRSYLLGAMKHFLANERSRKNALKRGGAVRLVDADVADIESRLGERGATNEPADADRAFDRDWARAMTSRALARLREEWEARGKGEQFTVLAPVLSGEREHRTELAARLGITENAAAVAVHRLRKRYAALVRDAVERTVADAADADDEMRYLVEVLRKNPQGPRNLGP